MKTLDEKIVDTGIRVPPKCLVCKSMWVGGHSTPGNIMSEGLRVFYECGASMSVKKVLAEGCYQILFKNCTNDEPTS